MNILVIGRAKTGTTVISKTIQHSMENAEYFLEPKSIIFFENDAHIQRKTNKVVKIIFEHWSKTPMLRNAIIRGEIKLKFDKIVAIVRDPRDEFISRFYYLIYLFLIRNDVDMTKVKEWLSIIEEKERNPKSLSFMTMVDKMNSLLGMNLKWPQSGKSDGYVNFLNNNSKWLHIIKYEDFIDNKVQQLEKYLGFNLSSERDIGDLSRTKRSAKYNNWKKIFTADDVRHMQNAFSFEMKAWGYADWELEDCLQLDPNDGSLYLNKLIEEALAKKISLARQPAQFRRN